MTIPDVWSKLTEILREVFDEEDLVVHADTTAEDVEGWTSLTHVELILEVESVFDIRLNTGEISGLRTVGDLVDLIEQRSSG